jgi:hypothetical protein
LSDDVSAVLVLTELTEMLALTAVLGGASLDVTLAMVLVLVPLVVAVTLMVITHVPLEASVPPESEKLALPAVALAVPLQLLVSAFGVATTRPAGRLSVKARPLSEKVALGLLMVTVSEVVPPTGIEAAPNATVTVGGIKELTVMVAVAVFPVPPLVEVTADVVLVFVPAVVALTLNAIVHDTPAATDPPVSVTVPLPAVAVAVPPQVLLSPGEVATTSPAGNASLKARPASAVPPLGLVMVKVSEVEPLTGIDAAPNALLIDGGESAVAVIVAVAVLPVPPLVELTGPVVLVKTPAVVGLTLTVIRHDALAAIDPPVRVTVPLPAVAVAVPPQLLLSPFGIATGRPAGSASVNATPVSAVEALGW